MSRINYYDYMEMRDCLIKNVPPEGQRYKTVGDWMQRQNGGWDIRVTYMEDWRFRALVALHEMVEMMLCIQRGISEQDVTDFDVAFEKSRQPGDTREPGDQPGAPYYKEHQIATAIERLMAAELGVNWDAYEQAIEALS